MSAGPAPTPGVEAVVGMPLGVDTPGRPPRMPPVPGKLLRLPMCSRRRRAVCPGESYPNREGPARWCRPSVPGRPPGRPESTRPARKQDRCCVQKAASAGSIRESCTPAFPSRASDSTLDWSPQVVPRFNRSPHLIPHARNNHCHRKSAVTTGNLEARCKHNNRLRRRNRRNQTTIESVPGSRLCGF